MMRCDFNGDGLTDIAATKADGDGSEIRRNNGASTFTQITGFDYPFAS